MNLELVSCPLDDFEKLFGLIKETYCMANNENPRLILVEMDKANKNTRRALDLLNKIFHYYDIPGAFDNEEVLCGLYLSIFFSMPFSRRRFSNPSIFEKNLNEIQYFYKKFFSFLSFFNCTKF